MEVCLLDLPPEILEIIILYIIGRPWKEDIRDFLAFTSTCRLLRDFAGRQKYWRIMALRRDSTSEKPPEPLSWLEYCKQIYSTRVIPGDKLREHISQYNNNYFCTIEKVVIWPSKIRVYIDERGDKSLGTLQHPMHSIVALVEDNFCIYSRPMGIRANDSKFSIEDETSEYLGYLDFPYGISLDNIGKNLVFQYGIGGYTNALLFHIDRAFINKYNLIPLFKRVEHSQKPNRLLRTRSI